MVSIPTWLYMWNPKIICNNMIINNLNLLFMRNHSLLRSEPDRFKCLKNLEDGTTVDGKLEDYWVGWHRKNATKFAVSLKPHSYMAFSY